MFSNKNKNYKDSRIRFQHQAFKTRLKQARGHRRAATKDQLTASANILKILGAGSPLLKIVFGALLALIIYFIYIPNFLYANHIEITGLESKSSEDIRFLLAEYFAGQKLLPKNNILILPENDLASYLLVRDRDLLKISLKKQFPGTLKISAELRKNLYLLEAPQGDFEVSNDGLVSSASASSSSASSSLVVIKINGDVAISPGSPYPNQQQLEAVSFLCSHLPEIINGDVDYFEIENFKQPDITVAVKSGYKLFLDYSGGLTDALDKLHLLLTSIAPQDAKRLFYIDMTIKNRGYVCLKGAPCAVVKTLTSQTATSSASSTLDKIAN